MSVIRVHKTDNYTVMSNHHLRNKDMSLKAKGLLSLMLSLPNDWDYSIAGLVKICKESETSIKSTLAELKDLGYLDVIKLMPDKTETGRIEYIYNIYEISKQESKKQEVENLPLENLQVDFIGQLNTKELSTEELSTNSYSNNNNIEEEAKTLKKDTLYDYLQNNGFVLSPIHYEEVSTWEDTELTRYAIKEAVLKNIYTIKYISTVLNAYKQNNITTVQQAKEHEARRTQSFNKQPQPQKKDYRDVLDEWLAEKQAEDERRLANDLSRSY